MDLEQFPTSPSAKRMLSSVSEEFYAKSYVAKWLYQVMGLEWDAVWEIVNAIPEQAFVETATWGLAYHEIKWGLPVRENLDYATRRRLIYEKRDVRKPMNPWAMEQMIANLTGAQVRVKDGNDDPAIPPNVFNVQIDCENPGVDIDAAIRAVQKTKQSHVGSIFHIIAKARQVSFKIGVSGAIISRLAPTEQADKLSGRQTLRTGGRFAGVARQPPSEQPDNLSGRQTLRTGGQPQAVVRLPSAQQPDNLRAAQTVHTGGRLAGVAKLPLIEQADDLSARRTLRTSGQIAAIANPAPVEQPDNLRAEHSIWHGGRPAVVSVMRGRQVSE